MARARNLPIIETVTLRGPVTVAYKRCREGFMCTALQFDIVGIGRTKREAFQEMRDLVEEHLEEILRSPEPVCFFNPSDAADWNVGNQENYQVAMLFERHSEPIPTDVPLANLAPLREHRESLRGVNLVPAYA